MFKWFSGCRTAEEGKKLYRDLSRKYHPDTGWHGDELKEITVEFRAWWKLNKDIHEATAEEKESGKTVDIEKFIHIINKLSTYDIDIDIVGCWLWLRGNTYPIREELKAAGCRWSSKHKLWYWTEFPFCRFTTKSSYSDLKRFYGCETIKGRSDKAYLGG